MQQRFLLQILLLAQHVSGITMPIIGRSRVYTVVAACGISCCKNVKNNFVSFCGICVLSLKCFVFSVLSVLCYLGLLLGVSKTHLVTNLDKQ